MGASLCHDKRVIDRVIFNSDEEESDELALRGKSKSSPVGFTRNLHISTYKHERDLQSNKHPRLGDYKSSPTTPHRSEKFTAKANPYKQEQSDDLFQVDMWESTALPKGRPQLGNWKSSPVVSPYWEKLNTTAKHETQRWSDGRVGMRKISPHLYPHGHKGFKNTVYLNKPGMHTRAFSLRETILAHEHDIGEFVLGEHEAKLYKDTLENDTLQRVNNAVRLSAQTLNISNDISEEIARQGEVIDIANNDIHIAEQEIDESHHMIRGMKSIPHKIANMVWNKKPKVLVFDDLVQEKHDSKKIRRRSISDIVTHRKSLTVSKKQQKNTSWYETP